MPVIIIYAFAALSLYRFIGMLQGMWTGTSSI